MAETKIPKERLGPLAIDDDDVSAISLSKLDQSAATGGQVPQWDAVNEVWKPGSLVAGSTYVDNEEPVGLKNSINTVFTLLHLPSPPASLQLFIGGMLLVQGIGNDYTIDNLVITFVHAPGANDSLRAYYRR